jgi:ribA/ribD-fused uncharacterized protein
MRWSVHSQQNRSGYDRGMIAILKQSGRYRPVVVCDQCGEVITNAMNAMQVSSAAPEGKIAQAFHVHKGACDETLSQRLGSVLGSEELSVHLIELVQSTIPESDYRAVLDRDTSTTRQNPSSADRAIIRFYRTGDEFGAFSNFAPFPIRLKGVDWPTTEHYFQAQKFAGTPHEEEIRQASSASEAANMGRDRKRPLRTDWNAVKDDIMREAVMAKFLQHASLLKLLASTGEAEIVEHTKNDSYWGDGGDGSGLNMLGRILTEVRAKLCRR